MTPEEKALHEMDELRIKTYMAQDEKTRELIKLLEPEAQRAWLNANLVFPADPADPPTTETRVLPDSVKRMIAGMGVSEEEYLALAEKYAPEMYAKLGTTTGSAAEEQPVQLTALQKEYAQRFGLTEDEYRVNMRKAGQ